MARITVTHAGGALYHVVVDDGHGTSRHQVTVTPADVERYAPVAAPEELIEASFEFLLAREPKESILSRFELPVIERYFPDYSKAIRDLLP